GGKQMARFILLRRQVVIGVLIVLLTGGIAVATFGKSAPVREQKVSSVTESSYPVNVSSQLLPKNNNNTDDYFVDYRIERETKRSRQIELLREIAAMSSTSESTRKQAQEEVINLMQKTEKEARIENLLRARGFRDAAVAIEEQGITVVVPEKVSPEVNTTVVALVYHSIGLAQEQVLVLGRE
ncbi:MAG: SpoIIIAH-like family protein, partial [Bacillota bacterium]